jgi:hypothetical protein
MSVPTGLTVSGSPITTSGTLAVTLTAGYSIPTTANQSTWTTAYNRSLTSAAVTGTTTKTLTLNQQDGGTITASWTDINTVAVTSVFCRTGAVVATEGDYTLTQLGDVTITSPSSGQVLKYNGTVWINDTDANTGTVTSVAMTVPTGLSIAGSPITSSGTLAVTFAAGYSIPTNASQTTWDTAYTNRITSLTTTGTSGAATLVANVLNIPNYTTDLSAYVTLATSQTITGVKTFSTYSKFDGGIILKNNVSASLAGYVGLSAYSASGNKGINIDFDTYSCNLFFNGTLPYSYTFPNATGTIALTSDIPSLSGYVTIATTQTITGTKTFTSTITAPSLSIINSDGYIGTINSTNANGGYLEWRTSGTTIADIGTSQQIFATGGNDTFGINARGARSLVFGTNNTLRLTISSLGAATFSSTVQATQYTATSTGGSGLRVYGGSGTHQWDMYLNGANIRFSDNTGGGSFVVDNTSTFNSTLTAVGINIIGSDPLISLTPNSGNSSFFQKLSLSNGDYLRLYDGTNYTMFWKNEQVAIGTGGTFSTYMLDVNGTGRFSNSLTVSGNLILGSYVSSNITLNTDYKIIVRQASMTLDAVTPSYFGYSSGYGIVKLGSTDSNRSLAFNVDVTGNPSGSFSGNGSEYVWRNTGTFLTPNASNNGYNKLFDWGTSGQMTIYNAAIFNSSVTATSFFESSDSRLKTLIQDNYQTKGIGEITPKLYTKNGKVELGYYAQDFIGVLDNAILKGSDDMLSLSYREVHTAKIYALEQEIKELKAKLN